MALTKKAEEQRFAKDLEFKESYVFNPETRQYVVFLKTCAKPIVVSEEMHKAMLNAYCGEDARSVEEISAAHSFPSAYFREYVRIFGWTREGMPLTDEDVLNGDVEVLVDDLIARKRFEVSQKFQKKDWETTQKDALKWREFEGKAFNPFSNVLEKWKPPVSKVIKSPRLKAEGGKTWVAALSDLHFGSAANAKYMYSQKEWNTQKTCEAVDRFADAILADAKSRNYNLNKAVILGLGDIAHSFNGKTARGTELKFDCIREEQFDYALSSLTHFISRILMAFPEVEVHSVGGNHHYEIDMAIFRALACFFHKQENIKFTHYSTRPAAFRTGNTLFMLDHGADSVERTYVPGIKNGLEKHVQSLLLQKPELLEGVKTRLFCQGDKHHFENVEYNDFEFIMFSKPMVGDEHSSVNNWNSRGRQSSLVIDETGLKEVIHTYME
jgi:hypothetical protein